MPARRLPSRRWPSMPYRASPLPSTNELEQIRFALDQSAIVATTDVPGRIKYVNDKFCEISKYSRDELIGQDHRILNSGHHSKDFIRALWRTIAQGGVWRGELRNRAKDGSLYWVDTTIVPFLDESGKPWQYMAIRYDITERKRHEQKLFEQAALTSLGEMAAVVAHEVRNPLAGIRSGIQILSSQFALDTEGRDLTSEIIARVDSLNAVLSDILTFARVRELRKVDIDVDAFSRDLVSSMRLDPAMTGVTLLVRDGQGFMVHGDIDQLRLVFTNLILNAAQAMNHDGSVELTAAADDTTVCLSVSDTGSGIPADVRDRVFDPFFTTKIRGSGLGLPTAKRIVEAHGGRLAIADRPGGGTVVAVTLPRAASR
jgi:PAS domain S-box-containing protein